MGEARPNGSAVRYSAKELPRLTWPRRPMSSSISSLRLDWLHYPQRAIAEFNADAAALLLPVDDPVSPFIGQGVGRHSLFARPGVGGGDCSKAISLVIEDDVLGRASVPYHD